MADWISDFAQLNDAPTESVTLSVRSIQILLLALSTIESGGIWDDYAANSDAIDKALADAADEIIP